MVSHTVLVALLSIFTASNALAVDSRAESHAAANPSWYQYVRSPSSKLVKPVSVVSGQTKGGVSNPTGLLTGNQPTVLTRASTNDQAPSLVLDFGQNVVGLLQIGFTGSSNTSQGLPGLQIAFSETMQFLSSRSDYTRSDRSDPRLTPGSDQVAVENRAYTWTDTIGCAYGSGKKVCADGLHAFRYVRITFDIYDGDAPYVSRTGSISISSVALQWQAYLGTPDTFTGYFECSDKNLTQWWYDGVYTVDLGTDVFRANESEPRNAGSPSLEGKQVLLDGAKRDRDPYVGDLAVASLTSYLSHNFAQSTKNVLVDLAQHQRSDGWIPPASINNYTLGLFDYPLWWVVASMDYVLYTGDVQYAATYWDTLTRVLDNYYPKFIDSSTGLLSKTDGSGDYAFINRAGPITYYNALYVHALKYAARIGHDAGRDQATLTRWTDRAANISAATRQHNFDNSVGAFYDGGPCPGQPAGTYCNIHSQDGNSLAILTGIADSATSQRALNYYANATAQPYGNAFYDSGVIDGSYSTRVYAFLSYFEIAARFSTSGQAASAFDEIRRLYGWMASHEPGITMWEGISSGGAPYEGPVTSMAHGWSTGVVALLSNYVLGVKPVTAGFAQWEVSPVVDGGGLTWATGRVPTPLGPIDVSWNRTSSSFSLNITSATNSKGVAYIPKLSGLSNGVVKVDGKVVSHARKVGTSSKAVDTYATVNLSGGAHTITVTPS